MRRRGYTLVELMVALVIVAILATITYSYGSQFLRHVKCWTVTAKGGKC